MFELYRYEIPSGTRKKHVYQFPTIRAAKIVARHHEELHPGLTVMYEIADAGTGVVIWEGLPHVRWRHVVTGRRERW